jgi:hypothetical protein
MDTDLYEVIRASVALIFSLVTVFCLLDSAGDLRFLHAHNINGRLSAWTLISSQLALTVLQILFSVFAVSAMWQKPPGGGDAWVWANRVAMFLAICIPGLASIGAKVVRNLLLRR